MLEILCRGESIDTNEWVYGYYVKCRGRTYILPELNELGFDERYADWCEVKPSTVDVITSSIVEATWQEQK